MWEPGTLRAGPAGPGRSEDGMSGKRPCVANVAVDRELVCWVWELGCRAEGTMA